MHFALASRLAVFSALFSLIFALPTYAYDRDSLMGSFSSIVMVRGYNPDGSLAYGSGVVVEQNKVMTNCHIFHQTKQPWVSRGEDTFAIVSVQADRYHDVCLLTVDSLPIKPVPIGKASDMKKGQEVIAIGHSSGTPAPLTSAGTLKSLYEYNNGKVIRTTARFAMGASGSGLFNGQGQLIGINTFKSPGRSAYFYALPVEWLAELQKQPVETKFPINGKAFWEEEDLQKPFFMQMAIPEIKQDWAKLSEVAERWTKAEPMSTEAWYELGRARENLDMKADAELAYRQSVALDAQNTDSLFRIGVLASEKGDKIEMHSINLALLDIDKELADEFSKIVGCATQC